MLVCSDLSVVQTNNPLRDSVAGPSIALHHLWERRLPKHHLQFTFWVVFLEFASKSFVYLFCNRNTKYRRKLLMFTSWEFQSPAESVAAAEWVCSLACRVILAASSSCCHLLHSSVLTQGSTMNHPLREFVSVLLLHKGDKAVWRHINIVLEQQSPSVHYWQLKRMHVYSDVSLIMSNGTDS